MATQKQKTIFVDNVFSTSIFLVLKSGINEQSVVILWFTDSRMSASEKDLPVCKNSLSIYIDRIMSWLY